MGLFGSIFGERIANENKSKPFYKNATTEERREWFATTRPWHKVPRPLIEAMIGKLDRDRVMFEVFIIRSMETGLVERFSKIDPRTPPEVMCAMVSGMLTQVGSELAKKMIALQEAVRVGRGSQRDMDEASKAGSCAIDLLQAAVVLDANAARAFNGLAFLLAMVGRIADAAKYGKDGLEAIRRMMREAGAFRQSSVESIRNAPEMFQQMERALAEFVESLEHEKRENAAAAPPVSRSTDKDHEDEKEDEERPPTPQELRRAEMLERVDSLVSQGIHDEAVGVLEALIAEQPDAHQVITKVDQMAQNRLAQPSVLHFLRSLNQRLDSFSAFTKFNILRVTVTHDPHNIPALDQYCAAQEKLGNIALSLKHLMPLADEVAGEGDGAKLEEVLGRIDAVLMKASESPYPWASDTSSHANWHREMVAAAKAYRQRFARSA
jgi:hypothetical protein